MADSPMDIISRKIAEKMRTGAIEVGDAVVDAGVTFVKNGITEALAIKENKTKATEPPKARAIGVEKEEEEEEEEGDYDDGEDSPVPIAFNAFDADKNLECAIAAFRLWGIRDDIAEEDDELPDIVALNPTTGIAFVGTVEELQQVCQHYDLDDKWEMYGINEDGEYDSSEIDRMSISKKVVKYIATRLIAMNYDHDKMSSEFKTNHLSPQSSSVARMLVNIPFLGGVPMAHFAIPYAIIYGAEKNGKFDTYIHEFGEASETMPTMYTVGDGSDVPRSLVIHGGKMVVKNGYICH